MARIPPSHIGPKHMGSRVAGKGPASTKTLTTNTLTSTTGVTSVIHDPSVPRTYLFDIYKNEAESHFEIGEYRAAADCYNAAIKLQPSDTAAIVARSRCYAQMGRWKRSMRDCDEALSIDPSFSEALYQKAEILYINGNFDLAHVYFKRGLRQQPDSILFKNAVQKAADAMHKCGGAGGMKPAKLTAVGDLTMFSHGKKRTPRDKDTARMDEDIEKLELPSAGFRSRFQMAPLVRINKKPGVSLLRTYRSESARSGSSAGSDTRLPDEPTMRTILGELYGDRKYLKKFQNNLPGGKAERDLTLLADEGLDFLRERTMFWDSLGPLPPPQAPKRSNMRERSFFFGSTESINTIGGSNNVTPRGGQPQVTKPRLPKRQKKKKLEVAMGLEKDCTSINFRFRSLQESRSASRIDHSPDGSSNLPTLRETGRMKTRAGRNTFGGIDDRARDRKRELTKFINNEMDVIDEAFKTGEFSDCKFKAEACLNTVADLEGEDINRSEVMASLHSCIGNASIAMNDFDTALKHHMEALTIGETEDLHEVINRSLGHLGRMYIIQKRFNKALEVFARKAPTVVSAEEVAQVFHEIGNCFLALGHLDYARDCGKKALRAALDADIHYFKFQSWVLIAVSESRMKRHDEAYKAFSCALDLAKKKDDQESINVILFAMEHLSKTITSLMKKREMLSERLMSRSKTQTIIDLNKRPHAARQKKRKKKMRREGTFLDDTDLMTRQTTMLEPEASNKDGKNVDGRHHSPLHHSPLHGEAGATGASPSSHLEVRRGSFMFEESPRELEPFGDPRVRSQRNKEKLHKRHGTLDHMDGRRSGRESGTNSNLDYSRERTISKLDHNPRSPRAPSKLDSSREMTRSHSKMGTPADGVERSTSSRGGAHGSPKRAGLSPIKRLDIPSDGRYSGRDSGPMTDRTGLKSRGEYDNLVSYRGDARLMNANRRRSLDEGVLEERRSRGRQSNLRETPLEESRGDTTYDADISSGPGMWSSRNDDLTPGRYTDLSITRDTSEMAMARNVDHSLSHDNEISPRDRQHMHAMNSHSVSPRKGNSPSKDMRQNNLHRRTPGRFTRESFYEEEEQGANSQDMTKSFELVSVSRQHLIQSRGEAWKNKNDNEDREEKPPPPNENKDISVVENNSKPEAEETRGKDQQDEATPTGLERQSSKVSLKGFTNDENVTLETTKPYRVSSAASAKTPRAIKPDDDDDDDDGDDEDDATPLQEKELGKRERKTKLRKMRQSGRDNFDGKKSNLPLSPAKTPRSTGSGWDGDVSVDSPVIAYEKKSPRRMAGKPRNNQVDSPFNNTEDKRVSSHTPFKAHTPTSIVEDADVTNADVTLTSEHLNVMAANESTVSSLAAKEVQEDVIRNTEEAPEEEKELLQLSKEAHREKRIVNKIRREIRDLDDIQSVQYSSHADLTTTPCKIASPVPGEEQS